ncbi:M24 family metallopeptidase [Burkholderia stagnalis]
MHELTAPAYTVTLDTGTFAANGRTSILDAALAQGIAVPFSCQRGECGSCRATVRDGCFERMTPPTERSYATADDELLMCQCRATSDLTLAFPHWRAPARPPAMHGARVVSRRPLAPDVTQLVVELRDAEPPFEYLPGQHVRLSFDGGSRRCFSIANAPGAAGPARLEFHIRRQPGGAFTDGILPRLAPGDALTLEGPLGACVWPQDGWGEDVEHLVLLATGTGFAGVFPVLMAALHERCMKTVTLYWGGRTQEDCYTAPLLDALQGKHAGLRWHAALSGESIRSDLANPETEPDARRNRRVQDLALAAGHDWTRSAVYACGNPAMVRAARAQLVAAGLPHARFQSEAFLPPAADDPAPPPRDGGHAWERVGPCFTMAGILDARQRSMHAVREIAALLRPGVSTRDAITVADAHLRRLGASHNWHPTYVRFGIDTQSPAVQPTDFRRVLREDDVFVVDIGPVWDGYEGDYGDTFVMGAEAAGERCARAARDVFRRARLDWLAGTSGTALYERADAYARDHGCALVREIPGHRVADFPHALYGKHTLADADFVPGDGIWVLEIQVRDLTSPVGAFYEDVLLREM